MADPAGSAHRRLRLHGITTREAANAFLPLFIADYNRRFARPPADPTPAWRRPPRDLSLLLSCRYPRTVAPDNTVRLGPRWLQLPPGPGGRSYARTRVELRECLDGRFVALHDGRVLATAPAPAAAFVLAPRALRATPARDGAESRRARRPRRSARAPVAPPRSHVSLTALAALAQALQRRHAGTPCAAPASPPGDAPVRASAPRRGDDLFMWQFA